MESTQLKTRLLQGALIAALLLSTLASFVSALASSDGTHKLPPGIKRQDPPVGYP